MNKGAKVATLVTGILAAIGGIVLACKKSHDIGYDKGAKKVGNDIFSGNFKVEINGEEKPVHFSIEGEDGDEDVLYVVDDVKHS